MNPRLASRRGPPPAGDDREVLPGLRTAPRPTRRCGDRYPDVSTTGTDTPTVEVQSVGDLPRDLDGVRIKGPFPPADRVQVDVHHHVDHDAAPVYRQALPGLRDVV